MFTQLRIHYPKGSLVTELAAIDHGQYIVRCLVQNEGTTLVSAMAAAQTIEAAEDQARSRALIVLGIDTTTATPQSSASVSDLDSISSTVMPTVSPVVAETPTLPITTPSPSVVKTQPTQAEIPKSKKTSKKLSVEANTDEVAQLQTASPVVEEWNSVEASPSSEWTLAGLNSSEVETSQEVESEPWIAQKVDPLPQETPVISYPQNELEPETPSTVSSIEAPIDFSDIIARTNVELKRLGWTNQQGRDYLVQTYGKRSRQLLTDAELIDFLQHLESERAP